MSRQVNSGDPSAGFPTEKKFLQDGSIADADLTIIGTVDGSKKLVFDVSGQTTGKTVTIKAGANSNNITLTLPTSSGTISTGSGTGPVGSNNEIQYNESSSFASNANFTYDGTTLKVNNIIKQSGSNIQNSAWPFPGPGLLFDLNGVPSTPWGIIACSDVSDDSQENDIALIAGSNTSVAASSQNAGSVTIVSGCVTDSGSSVKTGAVVISSGTQAGSGHIGGITINADGADPYSAIDDKKVTLRASDTIKIVAANGMEMGSKKITGLADPSSNQDAATKAYVDSKILIYTSSAGSGGSATETMNLTGILSTDTILSVTQKTPGSNNTALIGYSNLTDGHLSAIYTANPGSGSVIVVAVKR